MCYEKVQRIGQPRSVHVFCGVQGITVCRRLRGAILRRGDGAKARRRGECSCGVLGELLQAVGTA